MRLTVAEEMLRCLASVRALQRESPLAGAWQVITQAARALVALEAHGLVHRDLKPANLMLVERPELTVKMIDFGLAKAAATEESESDITHGVCRHALFCQSGAIHKHQRR